MAELGDFPVLRGVGDDSDSSADGRAIGEEVYDTDGNVATDSTLFGDIDGRQTTLGAVRDYVAQDAAYYITSNVEGDPFATYAALAAATVFYSGGVQRIPTRNDYCVVLADETHGGSEWRYIYAVAEGETSGEWQAQYPIETNDYEALSNKPQINSVELSGNKTAAQLGIATPGDLADAIAPDFSTSATYAVGQLVNHDGTVYICTTAVTDPGAWTGSENWSTSNATVQDAINAIDVSSQITGKINSTSVAPDFDASQAYVDGTYVTHLGALYKLTADHEAGVTWENTSKETAVVMEPDATLDIVDGHLQVKNSQGVVIWQETVPPVTSVNTKTGAVTLQASDVGALSTVSGGTVNGNVAVAGVLTSNSLVLPGSDGGYSTITNKGVVATGASETKTIFPSDDTESDDEPYVIVRKQELTWANLPDKPTIPDAQVQADWDESDSDDVSYIKNKPDFDTKLNSIAAAPQFLSANPYTVGDYVTYLGNLYRFKSAHTAGNPWNSAEVDAIDMTSPDATLDVTSQGALRVVAADGTTLWHQGYNLLTNSLTDDDSDSSDGIEIELNNEAVNYFEFDVNSIDTVVIKLPARVSGKVSDFILDVKNPALDSTAASWPQTAFSSSATYAVDAIVTYDSKIWKCTTAVETAGEWTGSTNWTEAYPSLSFGTALDNTISVMVPDGESLDDWFLIAPGETSEFYFTLTAFQLNELPTYKVVKQVVVNGGA